MTKSALPFSSRAAFVVLMLTGACLYILYLPAFYVGSFNDDAAYILLAQSLLHGRFSMLFIPHQPPMTLYLPGYPLFLAPFVAVLAPHWSWMRITGIFLTLGSAWLMWKILKNWIEEPGFLLMGMACFVWNPWIALHSGQMMNDVCFVFSILSILCVLLKSVEEPSFVRSLLLGLLLAWCGLIRPNGILMLGAVGLGLAYGRRWASLALALGTAVPIIGGVLLRNYVLTHTASSYISFFHGALIYLGKDPHRLLDNGIHMLSSMIETVLPPVGLLSSSWAENILKWPLEASTLLLAGLGLRAIVRRGAHLETVIAATAFCYADALLLSIWTYSAPRYFLVFSPFFLFFLIEGVRVSERSFPTLRWFFRAAGWLLIAGLIRQNIFLLQRVRSAERPVADRFPAQTLQWIRDHTPANAVILSRASTIFLYTGRQGYGGIEANDFEEFRYFIYKLGIGYIYTDQSSIAAVKGTGETFIDQEKLTALKKYWVTRYSPLFPKSYQNSQEGTSIYAVKPDATYLEAYNAYLAAANDFHHSDTLKALSEIKRSEQLHPEMASSMNLEGEMRFQRSGDALQAIRAFEHVAALFPDNARALFNLGLAYQKAGQSEASERFLRLSEECIERTGEFRYLLPDVQAALVPAQ